MTRGGDSSENRLRSSSAKGVSTALIRTASSRIVHGRDGRFARCARSAVLACGFAVGVTESSRSYVTLSLARPRDFVSIRGEEAGTVLRFVVSAGFFWLVEAEEVGIAILGYGSQLTFREQANVP